MPNRRPPLLHPFALVVLATAALSGCFGPRWAAAPEGLAYGEPDPNPAAYTFRDSVSLDVHGPRLGALEVSTTRAGTAELEFRRGQTGFRVQVRFPSLETRFSGIAGDVASAGARALGGPLGLELGYRGAFEVVDTPSVDAALLEITDLVGLVRPLLVSLPGRAVEPGAAWTDTLRTWTAQAGTETRARFITRSTLLGDTTVAGRRLLRIAIHTRMETRLSGVAGGVEVEQELTGRIRGLVLWDDAARLLVERTESGTLEGSLRMPTAGVAGIPLVGRITREVSLRL